MTIQDLIEWLPPLLVGLLNTAKLWIAVLALGLPGGILLALGLLSKSKVLSTFTLIVVEIGRGVPSLVLIYLVYFGLPQFEIMLDGFLAATIALAITAASYTSEIFRAGFLAIPSAQEEAARSLGLNYWRIQISVIVPQVVRIVATPVLGYSVLTLQGTSLAFTVAYPELLSVAYNLTTVTFKPMPVLLTAAALYAVLAVSISQFVRIVEKRGQHKVAV